jgi:hypothetical protein
MDFLNEKQIHDEIITPTLDRLQREILPALETMLADRVKAATDQLSNIVSGAVLGAQGVEDKTASDLRAIMASLDGWTLTVSMPPISIPAITLRLTAPATEPKQ